MIARALMMSAVMLLTSGLASAADIQTTVDPKADFTKFQTFSFFEADPKAKGAITDKAVRERLRYLIAQHLNKKGYRPAAPGATADFGVHFAGHAEPKQRALMVGRPGPYSYGWGQTELGGVSEMAYREGNLVVDLVDIGKGQLLWRARIQEALTAGYSEENWKKADRALGDAFKSLPQRR